ncbi:MAG: hypothetical protein RRY20_00660, partial [Bilophila sp.]
MLSLLMPLGAVVVLLFLAARFVRSRDSLQAYQGKRLQHNEDVLATIHEDGKTLSPEEAMRPVVAGVRELAFPACVLHDNGASLRIETPTCQLAVVWILRTSHLTSATVSGKGGTVRQGHWELRVLHESP